MSDPSTGSDLRPVIEQRAYQRYLERGSSDGSDLDDWLIAEEEIRREQTRDEE